MHTWREDPVQTLDASKNYSMTLRTAGKTDMCTIACSYVIAALASGDSAKADTYLGLVLRANDDDNNDNADDDSDNDDDMPDLEVPPELRRRC